MEVFRPISMWRAAGLADKSTAYFRGQTPKNEKILLLASEKACSRLFSKMGAEGRALAQNRAVFGAAAKEVFNLLKEKGDSMAPDCFTKVCYSIGATAASGSLAFPEFSFDSWSVGKAFFISALVSTFIGSMFNQIRLSDFRDDVIRTFSRSAGLAAESLKSKQPGQRKAVSGADFALD
ncbi:MAG: hypothetical protein WCT52_00030 [Candidatus Micrarchaeia archaeon]|jgi:hypothetical protein